MTKEPSSTPGADLDIRREGWKWTDDTPYDHTVYQEWHPDEPNNENEECVRMRLGKWWAVYCSRIFYCLCEKAGESISTFTSNIKI